MIYVTDFASVYHAIINQVDPSPVLAIDYVKNREMVWTDKFKNEAIEILVVDRLSFV